MRQSADDLEVYIAEATATDPGLPARIDAALRRRELLRSLGDERRAKGLPALGKRLEWNLAETTDEQAAR